jgi:hypothetical protein
MDRPKHDFLHSRLSDAELVELVKSVCEHCGTVLYGFPADGLAAQEQDHLRRCPKASIT